MVDVHVADASMHALADHSLGIRIGDPIRVRFNAEKVQFFDRGTEQSLLWA